MLTTFGVLFGCLPLVSGSGNCPTGVGFVGVGCAAGCPSNAICYQGQGCCPLATCPSGSLANAFCSPGCSGYCYQGCCCDGAPPHLGYGRGAVYPLPGPGTYGGAAEVSFVMCPTGVPGQGICGSGCAASQLCYQGSCCPLASCPDGMLAHSFCGSGHACSSGGSCYQGSCCPLSPRPLPPAAPHHFNYAPQRQIQVTCPTGFQSTQACGGGCGDGYLCHSGACCPLASCAGGAIATGFCNGGGGCDSGICQNGCCCPPVGPPGTFGGAGRPGLPFHGHAVASVGVNVYCPTGVASSTPCGGGCIAGSLCYQGACCPLARCPTGNVASGFCGDGNCAGGGCFNGCCCPLTQGPIPGVAAPYGPAPGTISTQIQVTCPTGFLSTTPCGGSCGSGSLCHNGGCCPLAQCPEGGMATGFCAGGGCVGGSNCYNGCCCPTTAPGYGAPLGGQSFPGPPATLVTQIITCPTGVISDITCGSGCIVGHGCYQGACCPFATCPGGAMSHTFCGQEGACDGSCHQGCCCPTGGAPLPPQGSLMPPMGGTVSGMSVCPHGGNMVPFPQPYACDVGFFPHNSGCCPSFSTRTVTHTTTCSSGSVAFAHCSMGGGCPTGYQCHGTTCCQTTTTITTTLSIPGAECTGGIGCAGYATCQEGACACNSGYASNGISCVQSTPGLMDFSPRPCFGGCRRRKQSKLGKGSNETGSESAFFPPLANVTRTCKEDCTCTPAELCIEGRCLPRLVPGQSGCTHDAQCKYDCAASFCNSTTQRCECHANQLVLPQLGLCYLKCPRGTIARSGQCVLQISMESLLLKKDMREKLEAHTCGSGFNRECGSDTK